MRPRNAILIVVAIGLVVGAFATARLGVVVAATPRSLLFDETLRFADPAVPIEPGLAVRAEGIASRIADPGLFRARIGFCRPEADGSGSGVDYRRCLAGIDDALRAAPALGELWLFKATVRIHSGRFDDETLAALRNAYRTAPREGWIAAARTILGLRLYPVLPADLQARVGDDLVMVLGHPHLSKRVAEAYAADFTLRESGGAVIRDLPPDLLYTFVGLVRNAAGEGAAGLP
jgi:hypothetical protein